MANIVPQPLGEDRDSRTMQDSRKCGPVQNHKSPERVQKGPCGRLLVSAGKTCCPTYILLRVPSTLTKLSKGGSLGFVHSSVGLRPVASPHWP